MAGHLSKPQVKSLTLALTAPTSSGRPLIADYMGTCWISGFGAAGALTVGYGFVLGATQFLQEQNSSLQLVGNVSQTLGNITSAPAKADILIRNVGNHNNPVIAEYFYGFAQGHFSPVTDYAVYDSGANGLNIKTLAHPNTWYSLSGSWGTERGVFALE